MKTYNIPIFVPHRGCPFDCVFCNQKRITGQGTDVTARDVRRTIEEYLKTLPASGRRIEAAFFGGSFTGIPLDEQTSLLSAAYEYVKSGKIDGIRLSTRPDYISREILKNLAHYGVTTIELGVQSMDSEVLEETHRGHTAQDVLNAVRLIREYPFILGLQMMTGLPADTDGKCLETADKIIALKPDIVRIYPTLTIKDTYLEKMYQRGEYAPQTVCEAKELCKKLLLKFEKNNIRVIRIGLQPTDEICEGSDSVAAGPVHSAFGELVESAVYLDIILDALKGKKCERAEIFVSLAEISKATGNRKENIRIVKEKTGIDIKIRADKNLNKREVKCTCC